METSLATMVNNKKTILTIHIQLIIVLLKNLLKIITLIPINILCNEE